MGHRNHAAAACGHRAFEDHVGCADHHPARAAARPIGGVVLDRGGECEGVWLAAAVSCLPAATARAAGRGDGSVAAGRVDSCDKTGAHAAGKPGQDLRR